MQRFNVYVSRPMPMRDSQVDRPKRLIADDEIDQLLHRHGFMKVGSGKGAGMRDLDYISTEHAPGNGGDDALWYDLQTEIAKIAGCSIGEVKIAVVGTRNYG